MTFESHPKSTSMHEPNYEQSEKYSIANDDYTVFSVIPLGLRNTPLRITRFIVPAVFSIKSYFVSLFLLSVLITNTTAAKSAIATAHIIMQLTTLPRAVQAPPTRYATAAIPATSPA